MIDFLEKYLILETVEQDIIDAINNHQVLYVNYKGNKQGAVKDQTIAGVRHFLPVAIGLSKKGNVIARVYLTSRGVQTGWREHETPWKTIRVDRISQVVPRESDKDFWKEPPAGFNPRGDRSMIEVYAIAKFGTDQAQPSGGTQGTRPRISSIQTREKIRPSATEKGEYDVVPSKIEKIPDNAKVTLKPEPKPKAAVQTKPAPPKPKAEKPIPTEPTQPEKTAEPPAEENPKPMAESWMRWLNKIVNT